MRTSIVVAVAKNGAIGKGNELLWKLPDDMRHFKELTSGHAVIMGRKTFESIGRPLPNRMNIIITRQADYRPEGTTVVPSVEAAIQAAQSAAAAAGQEEVFVIGGAQIYKEALPRVDRVYLTRVEADFDGDAFFPELDPKEWRQTGRREGTVDEKNSLPHAFLTFDRVTLE